MTQNKNLEGAMKIATYWLKDKDEPAYDVEVYVGGVCKRCGGEK